MLFEETPIRRCTDKMPSRYLAAILALALLWPTPSLAASSLSTPKPNQVLSFKVLHNVVDAGLLQWKDCKPGPTSLQAVSVADFERYVEHKPIPLPANREITYSEAIQYGLHDQACGNPK
jgi:hypothetical protein